MRSLLDTNVISELVARHPDNAVLRWIEALDQTAVYLSVITIGEIHRGIERLPESAKRERRRAWLTDDLLVRFSDRIVPIDVGVMMASQLSKALRKSSLINVRTCCAFR